MESNTPSMRVLVCGTEHRFFLCIGCLRTMSVAEAKVGKDGTAWNVCLWCAPTKWHLADPLRVMEQA